MNVIGPLVEAARDQVHADDGVLAAFGSDEVEVLTTVPQYGERRAPPPTAVYFPVARRVSAPDRCADRFQFELQATIIGNTRRNILQLAAITEAVEARLRRLVAPAGLSIGDRSHDLTHVEFNEDRRLMMGVVRFTYSVTIL